MSKYREVLYDIAGLQSDRGVRKALEQSGDRIEALEEWVRDSARHHHEAAAALPDSHGEPHRDLCRRARTLLSTTKEEDDANTPRR